MNDQRTPAFDELHRHCAALPPGPVADVPTLRRLLADAWNSFVSDDGGMEPYKLLNRMEAVTWNSPILSFRIERHGGTALGSSRAEMQHWELDLEKMAAILTKTGHRQLRPMVKRIYMKPLVVRILDAVRSSKEDDVVCWYDDGRVFVKTTTIFPTGSAVRMTLEGRRKRLRDAVAGVLMKEGWERLGADCFKRRGSER